MKVKVYVRGNETGEIFLRDNASASEIKEAVDGFISDIVYWQVVEE